MAILSLVGTAVVVGAVLATMRGEGLTRTTVLEAVLTALFAGFVISPPLTVAALAVVMAVSLWSGSSTETMLALALASGFTARTGSMRLLLLFVALLLVSTSGAVLAAEGDQATAVVVYLLLATVSGAIGFLLRAARQREHRFRAQLARTAVAEREIRKSERLLIADELHDVVSHDLTVIAMQAELLTLGPGPAATGEPLEVIRGAARKALTDLHRVIEQSDEPRTPVAHQLFDAALADARRELAHGGFELSAVVDEDAAHLPRMVSTTLARIVRESVTNILKHAAAGPVEVRVQRDGADAVLTVRSVLRQRRDVARLPSGGYGSVRMAERVALLGGHFRSGPQGDAWVVTARLPFSCTHGPGPGDEVDTVRVP